jgi:hypothetical protein
MHINQGRTDNEEKYEAQRTIHLTRSLHGDLPPYKEAQYPFSTYKLRKKSSKLISWFVLISCMNIHNHGQRTW